MILGETWRLLARKYIAYDVPDEMAACFNCGVVRCPDSRYETCPYRLARAAALRATDGGTEAARLSMRNS
jgi:hypothetical protein